MYVFSVIIGTMNIQLHINHTLLDTALEEKKITFYEYNFIKARINSEMLAEFGLTKKQEAVFENIYPKLYSGTIYLEERPSDFRQLEISAYEYQYEYEYEPTDEELDAIEKMEFTSTTSQSKDL